MLEVFWYSRFCSAYSVTRASLSNLPQTGVDPTHNPSYSVKYRRGVCSLGARRGQPGDQMWQSGRQSVPLESRKQVYDYVFYAAYACISGASGSVEFGQAYSCSMDLHATAVAPYALRLP